MSLVPGLLQAAVEAINGGSYAVPGIVAQKDYSPNLEIEQVEGVLVVLTPAGDAELTGAGSTLDGMYEVVVSFKMIFYAHIKSPSDETEVENLINLMSSIRSRVVSTVAATSYIFQNYETDPLYDFDMLRKNLFESVTTFRYMHPAV